ncbi:hypothetical protein HGRIS_002632 [Hohenbuehelia grisea]|uniref:Uncharacterized protein n=1 Tax=Hohenbuehelia grisea TaxID=104357 RepID=A0ABR3JN54_9AGAR
MFSQLHLFPHNPYPVPPPPPIAHKVWILDCASCGLFLTNRGMKAVLLLRPNVSLYSSDALPVNCSAYSPNADALRPPPVPSGHPPRTCECLTQTLCCHGCGTTVGYMIVIPCTRCTSSITATNRATNGHRFVFHSSEIRGTERHYIHAEPGVHIVAPILAAPVAHANRSFSTPDATSTPPRPEYLPSPPLDSPDISPPFSNSPSPDSSALPPYTRPVHSIARRSPPTSVPSHHPYSTSPPPLAHAYLPPNHYHQHSISANSSTESSKDIMSPPTRLKPGNVVYWHHLSRHGEIPGVTDDERARGPCDGCRDAATPGGKGAGADSKTAIRGKKMMFFDR